MKKTIAILLSILILLNICSPMVMSADINFGEDETLQDLHSEDPKKNYEDYMANGTVTTFGDESDGSASTKTSNSTLEGVTKLISGLLSTIPWLGNKILSIIANGELMGESFTIQKLLSNKYVLTNINFFEQMDEKENYGDTMNTIRDSISLWYVSIRNVAAVAVAIVLLYVAIRMAISTVADDRAKYKKMFQFWLEAVALLFLMHYIVIMDKVTESSTSTLSIEELLLRDAKSNLQTAEGAMNTVVYLVLYFMLVYYELKFFIMYLTRVIRIGFYMVIAPLVCVTYPIDKIGDGKAQAFRNWFTEMLIEIFLQTIHLGVYIVFIFSAGEIIELSPFVGVVFFAALGNAEKIVRNLLKIKPKFAKGISETKLPGQGK